MASEVSMDDPGTSPGVIESGERNEAFEERIEALEERNRELEMENERLRSVTGPKVSYRRAAILLILVSAVATAGAFLYPDLRDVLIGVAGTGAFGAILLGMLVQEWLLSASVARALYDTLWRNERQIASRLGVAETSRYVPRDEELGVRLYLSQTLDDPIPPAESLGATVVTVEGHYTLLLNPIGQELFGLYERTNGELPGDVRTAAVAMREAVIHQFELAIGAEVVDIELSNGPSRNQLRVRVWGSVLGDATRLDHPIRSFLGVGLAELAGTPVESEAWTDQDENAVLAFRWESEAPGEEVLAEDEVFLTEE
jgi:hypothetical protein